MARWRLGAAAAAGLVFALAGVAQAAPLWTLTASPLAATVGQSTTFSMLAMNVAGPPAGCLTVGLPTSFVIQSVGRPVASNGSWTSAVSGNQVEVTSVSGLDKLGQGGWMRFTLQLLPTTAGTWTWTSHIQITNQCTGTESAGTPVVVVVAPAVVPTAVPTLPPIPTPLPSILPTAVPSVLPTALPSLLPTTTPRPTPASTAAPTPDTTPTDRPTSSGGGSDPSGGSGSAARLASLPEADVGSIGLSADVLARLDGQMVWFVPGAAVAVPGLLVLVWIGLQTIGALAWVPAVRRMSGVPASVRRRRRPAQ